MHKEGLVRRCVTGLLCLLLTACGEPGFRPLAAGETILAFGDSLTEGRGVSPAQSYPSVLASLSGHPVINGGVSGELSQAGRARLPALLAEHRPALVILLEGGNDMLRGSGEGALKANLAAMIEVAQGSGAQVLLVAVPQFSLLAAGTGRLSDHPLYTALAKELQLPLLEGAWAEVLSNPALRSDQVHGNAAGYALFTQQLFDFVRQQGWHW